MRKENEPLTILHAINGLEMIIAEMIVGAMMIAEETTEDIEIIVTAVDHQIGLVVVVVDILIIDLEEVVGVIATIATEIMIDQVGVAVAEVVMAPEMVAAVDLLGSMAEEDMMTGIGQEVGEERVLDVTIVMVAGEMIIAKGKMLFDCCLLILRS